MGTTLSEVVDLFLSSVSDYRIDALYESSGSMAVNTQVERFLLDAIDDFDICDQSLEYTPITTTEDGYFTEDLAQKNKDILSDLMSVGWLEKGLKDRREFTNIISDHDFNMHSPAQNIIARSSLYIIMKEKVDQRLNRYSYNDADWDSWNNQNFI